MRRFEMREGTASKFWEVDVRAKDVFVCFGRMGTKGQTKKKRLASHELAQKEMDKLVREKLAKGYAEKKAKPKSATTKPKVASSGKAPSMVEIWERIERWFAKHEPGSALSLRPPAKEKQIAAAERAMGVRFPADFRASLLVHDGQDDTETSWLPVERLGSLESIVECWKGDRSFFDKKDPDKRFDWLDREERVRQIHLHPKHIPFGGSPHWDYDRLLFDFVPGPNGTVGQIIKRDDIDLVYVADTFGEFLAKIASDLERKKENVYRR